MCVGAVIRQKREESNLTQKELGRKVGVSESTLRMYELGAKRVPHDLVSATATVLKSPEICYAKCQECPVNWLSICTLAGDKHPSTEILKIFQETREAMEAVKALAQGVGSNTQRPAVERACDQVLDLVPLAAAAVSSWCRAYGLDMREVQRRHREKLETRGYLRKGIAA